MTGKDLFEIISDIDDNYITEAHEEDILNPVASSSSEGASSSSAKAPVPAAPAKRAKLIRFVLPTIAGIAAIALAVFGLWKAGIIGGKKNLIEPQSDSIIAVTDTIDPDLTTAATTIPMTTGDATTTTESTEAHISDQASEVIVTNPTDFHGDLQVSISIPEDKKIEKDGVLVPSELELTITNEGTSPLYIEEVFTLQKQGDDGEWEDATVFRHETMPFDERCIAAGDTSTITVGILPEHGELWSGPARLILNVHFYEPDPNDWRMISHETAFYMKAADFDL